MKNKKQNKYLIAIIVLLALIFVAICFGGGYGIAAAEEIFANMTIEVAIAILGLITLSIFIFKLYSNEHAWEKLYAETRQVLIKTSCELADAQEEVERLNAKLDMIKELYPEIELLDK